jgi:hypothetical protein
VFASATAMNSRTTTDLSGVEAEMPPNNNPSSTNLVKIYVRYAGSSVVSRDQLTRAQVLDTIGLQSEYSSAVISKLKEVIESYKSLRNSFITFYNENPDLPRDVDIDSSDPEQLDKDDDDAILYLSGTTTTDGVKTRYDYYLKASANPEGNGKSRFQQLIDLVQLYFTKDTGAIQQYTNTYNSLFTTTLEYGTQRGQLAVAAPFAYSAPTAARDKAVTKTSEELEKLVTTYNTRYDYLRPTQARLLVAQKITEYWNLLAQLPNDIQSAEIQLDIYKQSKNYIDLSNPSAPNYPFTQVFMNLESVPGAYGQKVIDFQNAHSRLLESLAQKYYNAVLDFVDNYDTYLSLTPMLPQIRNESEVGWLYSYIKGKGAGGVEFVSGELRDNSKRYTVPSGQSVSSETMFSYVLEFNNQMELYKLTDEYKKCLNNKIGSKGSFEKSEGAIKKLFGTSKWAFF